jgi:4-amino-4-deoxy-L-arabinose transferase-like glycosyltransferase
VEDTELIEAIASAYTWTDWVVGPLLFLATAAVVVWQNSRITVLYDLCGVLEPAYRMSLGQRPYLDFPFPYAPLMFLTQAAVIKLGGTVYWHHIAYAAIVAGLATVITWRILLSLFRDSLAYPRATAFLLSMPTVVLGIYCIFPHPFYDPDACFYILLSILLLLWLNKRGFPPIPTILTGILIVVPLFVKQNIGIAFIGSIGLGLLILVAVDRWRKLPIRGYLFIIAGIVVGLVLGVLIIHAWVGLDNYKYWTWDFATSRRTPSAADMISVYQDPLLPIWAASLALGALLLWLNKNGSKLLSVLGVVLAALPFVWPAIYLLVDTDGSERAERLANVWPVVLIGSLVLSALAARRLTGVSRILPFILVCTAHGVFLSQQLWGSTYGIWPVFVLLVGLIVVAINELSDRRFRWQYPAFAAVVCVSLSTAGAFYVYSNERLDYVSADDGDLEHSTLPQLKGLAIRGTYLSDFEELVKYVNENIPHDDGILAIPGEDLFYYTTGRRPQFPALLFDVTNNPYSAEQIAELARQRNIQWLIVKNDLQIEVDKTIDDKDHILEALKPDFKHIESLNNYEIYRRRQPGETDDEDEDDNGGDNDDSDDSAN